MSRLWVSCIALSAFGGIFCTVLESIGSKKTAEAFRMLLYTVMAAAVLSGVFGGGLPDLFSPAKSRDADFSALSEAQMEAVITRAEETLADRISGDLTDRYGITVADCTVRIGRSDLSLESIRIVCAEGSVPFSTYAASAYLKEIYGKEVEVKFQ